MTTDRSFATECPVCLEELFDESGNCPDEGGVANIVCHHLIHSNCLSRTADAINPDGSRYGHGAFGNNAGCPICQAGASAWTVSHEAAFFPAFWISKVEAFLKEHGPVVSPDGRRMPVPARTVREAMRNDSGLSDARKRHIGNDPGRGVNIGGSSNGLAKALSWGGSRDYTITNVIFCSALFAKGVWKYDMANDDIWLWEWGAIHPRQKCAACGKGTNPACPLKQCSVCSGSSENACYCSKECQLSDWPRHKRSVCKYWKEYGPNGSKRP